VFHSLPTYSANSVAFVECRPPRCALQPASCLQGCSIITDSHRLLLLAVVCRVQAQKRKEIQDLQRSFVLKVRVMLCVPTCSKQHATCMHACCGCTFLADHDALPTNHPIQSTLVIPLARLFWSLETGDSRMY